MVDDNRASSIQYKKIVKRHVAVASEALANSRTVKKHRRRRTNVL